MFKIKKIEKGIYQEGKYSFRVRMMMNGHKVDKTFDDLVSARNFRDKHKLSQSLDVHETSIIESRIKKRELKSFTIREALDRYLKEVTPKKKGAKVEEYRIGRAKLTSLADKPFHGVRPEDFHEYKKEIGGSDNNKRKYISLVSHLFVVAKEEWEILIDNPVSHIKRPSNGDPRTRRLKGNEYDLLLGVLSGELRLFFILAIETAMRRGEILSLEWENVKVKNKTALLPDTKGGEPRAVPLSTRAVACFAEFPKPKKGKVFNLTKWRITKGWREACAEIGVDYHDLHIHDLRHEAISKLFENPRLNVMEIIGVTGHKTLEMAKRYTHLRPSNIADKLG